MLRERNTILSIGNYILFIFPALFFVILTTDIPFIMNLYYSVFEWDGVNLHKEFIGINNFIHLFAKDKIFYQSVLFTTKFTFLYVIFSNLIAFFVALALVKEGHLSHIRRVLFYIPYIVGLTAIGLIWKFILGPGFSSLGELTRMEFFSWSWLGERNLAFFVVLMMQVWRSIGFYMVIYIAGLITIPKEILEASVIDGVNSLQKILFIKIPFLMPSLSVCLFTSLTNAFKIFDIILVFTKGGPANSTSSIAYDIYVEAFTKYNYGLASAKSLVFFLGILVITLFNLKVTKNKEIRA